MAVLPPHAAVKYESVFIKNKPVKIFRYIIYVIDYIIVFI